MEMTTVSFRSKLLGVAHNRAATVGLTSVLVVCLKATM